MPIEFTFAPGLNADALPASAAYSFFFDSEQARPKLEAARVSGFRRIIIDEPSGLLGNLDVARTAAAHVAPMELVLTHWAGVLSPTAAASEIAELDRICRGRLALRMLTEGAAEISRSEQNSLLARTNEYLTLLKRLWSNRRPFDHEGVFYSVRNGYVARKGPSGFDIPIRMGGQSDEALRLAARHAHVFELSARTPEMAHDLISRVRAMAAPYGRADKIRFALHVALDDEPAASDPQGDAEFFGVPISFRALVQAGVSEFIIISDDGRARRSIARLGWAASKVGLAAANSPGTRGASAKSSRSSRRYW